MQTKVNPHAPLLSNPQLITTPPIDQLRQMSDSDLQHVQGFCVRKVAQGQVVGQICFKTPVNLLGVNLDNVIDIQRGMCTVNLGSPESF